MIEIEIQSDCMSFRRLRERESRRDDWLFHAYQELLPVVGVCRVLDEGEGGHGARLDQLRGQEDGRGSKKLELLLPQPRNTVR